MVCPYLFPGLGPLVGKFTQEQFSSPFDKSSKCKVSGANPPPITAPPKIISLLFSALADACAARAHGICPEAKIILK